MLLCATETRWSGSTALTLLADPGGETPEPVKGGEVRAKVKGPNRGEQG